MTTTQNWNDRIDEIIQAVRSDQTQSGTDEAKATIRTLFLDLVAEAKPDYKELFTALLGNNEYAKRAIDLYENNLIQAIGEK